MVLLVTHLPRNTDYMGSKPIYRQIHSGLDDNLRWRSTWSLGPISSGRLKNLRDVDKWSSLWLFLSFRGNISHLTACAVLCSQDGSNYALNPVVKRDIVPSINMQHYVFFIVHLKID